LHGRFTFGRRIDWIFEPTALETVPTRAKPSQFCFDCRFDVFPFAAKSLTLDFALAQMVVLWPGIDRGQIGAGQIQHPFVKFNS
jgi:hypothetical protein